MRFVTIGRVTIHLDRVTYIRRDPAPDGPIQVHFDQGGEQGLELTGDEARELRLLLDRIALSADQLATLDSGSVDRGPLPAESRRSSGV